MQLREQILAIDSELTAEEVDTHLERAGASYVEFFHPASIARHVRAANHLSSEQPVMFLHHCDRVTREVQCTVVSYDYPGVFSLIAGILAGSGMAVRTGEVFTTRKPDASGTRRRPAARRGRRRIGVKPQRRGIIDQFIGRLASDIAYREWVEAVQSRLRDTVRLLEKADARSIQQAKHQVNEFVTQRLEKLGATEEPILYPIEIDLQPDGENGTRLTVTSQDTPAFLYALSTALSLQGLSIEHVRIHTSGDLIEDVLDLTDASGRPITDPDRLSALRLSVLITKQFTYFLNRAPDPYAALSRFEQLLDEVLQAPDRAEWVDFLSNPRSMQDLARLLGASDYLWEDVIRLQYESLRPILESHDRPTAVSEQPERLARELDRALADASSFEEKKRALNDFKNDKIFQLDLEHILQQEKDFRHLAESLTRLAELVVDRSVHILTQDLQSRHGTPRTAGGLPARLAVLGLGKLGGAALGYASDIELLFVYSDSGRTDGDDAIDNAEFFGRLAQNIVQFIQTKREGIFRVDLRLRPHGNSGPFACSLETFCRYYAPQGAAHSFERLALVRLRRVAGDPDLGHRIERLRDDMLYHSAPIDVAELRDLRARQFAEKTRPDQYNAKFSPGALVDLEYAVQILQIMHGYEYPDLRTPRIHAALDALNQAGVLSRGERSSLTHAYDFLRQLINGLRLLRGSAKDLFLPPADSDEFRHLARRMGYRRQEGLSPERQLTVEFQTRTAAVRSFVERHFGRDSIPGPATGNIADLLLGRETPEDMRHTILREYGFRDPDRAYRNLQSLAGRDEQNEEFARLAVLAADVLRREPDPDMALNNWERFVTTIDDAGDHFHRCLTQPRRFEILLGIFSRSQFLADTLIREPQFLDWVTSPETLSAVRSPDILQQDLQHLADEADSHDAWLSSLRQFRRRELLRIGTRDMYLRMPIVEILRDLTWMADCITDQALRQAEACLRAAGRIPDALPPVEDQFCRIALGKLGGRGLNYCSDIDVIGLFCALDDTCSHEFEAACTRVLEQVRGDLSRTTAEGHVFRVDLRLRPYGGAGQLVTSSRQLLDYYRNDASLWEIQALLKARPIAGNLDLGHRFLDAVSPLLTTRRDPEEIVHQIRHMREKALHHHAPSRTRSQFNIKSGLGGIRDIEFAVQGLQMIHAHNTPGILTGNTLEGISLLMEADLLEPDAADEMETDYTFLRRVEHHLQILHDRQNHTLPRDPAEQEALARRMLGPDAGAEDFMKRLSDCLERVHRRYSRFLPDS